MAPVDPVTVGRANAWTEGIQRLGSALSKFEFLVIVGLVAVFSGFLLNLADALGLPPGETGPGPVIWGVRVPSEIGTVFAVILALSLAVLVLIGIYYLFTGFLEWRRGIWRLRVVAGSGAATEEAREARLSLDDAHRLVLCFVALIAVAIVVGIALGIVDGALFLAGAPMLTSAVFSIAEGVATGSVVILAYHYGTRHLIRALHTRLPAQLEGAALAARNWILAGALVGWVGSFSSLYWPLGVAGVLGAALVLLGVHRLSGMFDTAIYSASTRYPAGPRTVASS